MRKSHALLGFLLSCLVGTALGQGNVNFSNKVAADGINAPVYDIDGSTKLEGSAYLAQLYVGVSSSALTAVGTPAPFRPAPSAGYINGGLVVVEGLPGGQRVFVRVRAWEAAAGDSFEKAVANGGKQGESELVTVTLGGAGDPPSLPPNLLGLKSFSLQYGSPPVITKQPAAAVIPVGGSLELSVVAKGTPTLRYQWRKGGSPLSGAASDAYAKAPFAPSDAGNYDVVVENAFGAVTSQVAVVTVGYPPSIVKQPIGMETLAGSTVSLSVEASGMGTLSYQWYLESATVPWGKGSTLVLTNVQLASAGRYSVVVGNPYGTVNSAPAPVSVLFPLALTPTLGGTIEATPSRAAYAPMSSVSVQAKADDGYVFAGWDGDLSGTSNPVMLVMDRAKSVGATFAPTAGTVIFANKVILDGIDAPVFDTDGTTKISGDGFVAQLYGGVSATAMAPAGKPRPFLTGAAAGYFDSELRVIPTVAPGAKAFVQVRAWELSGGVTYEEAVGKGAKHGSSATLEVVTGGVGAPPSLPANLVGLKSFSLGYASAPFIVEQPKDQAVAAGGLLSLKVVAGGTEPLTYQWRKGGVNVGGADKALYEFSGFQAAQAGSYDVVVGNTLGSVTSQVAVASLLIPPSIVQQPEGKSVFLGSEVSLSVKAEGAAPLEYQWYHGAAALSGAKSATLTLPAVQLADQGAYSVVVRNPGGQATSITVNVQVLYRLDLIVSDGGTLVSEPEGPGQVPNGTVKVRAVADPGYMFAGWEGSLTGVSNPGTLVMDGNKSVGAVFAPTAGTVIFANKVILDGIDAPVFDTDGTTKISGDGFAAQLYGGTSATAMAPAGKPRPFLTGAAAGYFDSELRVIPTVAPGAKAFVQVRAWELSSGVTYEEAVGKGAKHGRSAILEVVTGGVGAPPSLPANLVGLKSFSLGYGVPPAIDKDPVGVTVNAGQAITLSVAASGTSPLTYQWFRDGTPLPSSDTNRWYVGAASALDAGSYYATVENSLGKVTSATAQVVVLLAPQITMQPASHTILVGTSTTLEVAASGASPLSFQWYEGETGDEHKPVGIDSTSLTTPELLTSVSYWVRVSNMAGFADSSKATISIQKKTQSIAFSALPDLVFGGEPLALTAHASSGLPVSYAVVSGPGALLGNILTPTGAGTVRIQASQLGDAIFGPAAPVEQSVRVAKAKASIVFSRLEQIYDGKPKMAGVTTTPGGLPVTLLYAGLPTPPTAAGSYPVEATVDSPNYEGTGKATLVVEELAKIQGLVYDDRNGDGRMNETEPGIPGVTIRLIESDGATVRATAQTGKDGGYQIEGLHAGLVFLEEVDPKGYASTTANRVTFNVSGSGPFIANFGDQAVGRVVGVAFMDLNGDGTQDEADPGLQGVTVVLKPAVGALSTTVTDETGAYEFSDLTPGSYTVEETVPTDFILTTASSRSIVLPDGGSISVAFGNQPLSSILGIVFNDVNGNGTQEASEIGLSGVMIVLTGTTNSYTNYTGSLGEYVFLGVPAGNYLIEETDPAGYASSTLNQRSVNLAAGSAAVANFGDQTQGTISGVAYEDTNGNGFQEAAEKGIAGVDITLTIGASHLSVTTTESGEFTFSGLTPGNYAVSAAAPAAFVQVTPTLVGVVLNDGAAVPVNFGFRAKGTIGGVVFEDLNGNGLFDGGEPGIVGVSIELTDSAGNRRAETTGGDGSYLFSTVLPGAYMVTEVDPSGYRSTTPNSHAVSIASGGGASASFGDQRLQTISGTVFEDLNANGIQDGGESGISGVVVRLLWASTGEELMRTTTTPMGTFVFANLPAGDYVVRQELAKGFTMVLGSAGARLAGMPGGTVYSDRSVELAKTGSAGLSFGNYLIGTISGYAYTDLNANGVKEPEERGIGGTDLALLSSDGQKTLRQIKTAGDGSFQITAIPAGDYLLRQTALAGFHLPASEVPVTIQPQGAATASFGNQPAGTMTGKVFNDENSNKIQDTGEAGIGGIEITLKYTLSGRILKTTTAGDGSYLFQNLESGEITITETDPEGFTSTTPNEVKLTFDATSPASVSFGDRAVLATPPSIVQQPIGATLLVGTNYTLHVQAEGSTPLFFQWRKNATNIAGATLGELALVNVTVADSGDYDVVVSNKAGITISLPAKVSVGGADPYTLWAIENNLPPGANGPNDDPDHDTIVNYFEFIFGSNPLQSSLAPLPVPELATVDGKQYLAMKFARSKQSVSVPLGLVGSQSLTSWSVVPSVLETLGAIDTSHDLVRVRMTEPISARPVQFIRLSADSGTTAPEQVTLEILPVSPARDNVRLVIYGKAGLSLKVQYSSDMVNWSLLKSVLTTGTTTEITDPSATESTLRFYRVHD